MDVVLSLLQATAVHGVRGSLLLTTHSGPNLQFHTVRFHIEADEQLQLIHYRTHQFLPIVLEGRLHS